jgi:hypothetical protein
VDIFISWSGETSRQVAELLSEWLKCVVQKCNPWISSRDIERGALWFGQISDRLRETSVGIICLTDENKEKPWILFEAGALAKGLTTSRVCTFLIDLKPSDIRDPLAQFNHTMAEKESVFSLVTTLNDALNEDAIERGILEKVFETFFPTFEKRFAEILTSAPQAKSPRPRKEGDKLDEILNLTSSLMSRVRAIERNVGPNRSSESRVEPWSIREEAVRARKSKISLEDFLGMFGNRAPRKYLINAYLNANEGESIHDFMPGKPLNDLI